MRMKNPQRRHIARVPCESCGPIDMPVGELTVRHCLTTGWCEYRFLCPRCDRIQAWKVNEGRVADVLGLTSAENYSTPARLEEWRLPEEWYEPHDGPALTAWDLVEFVNALDGLPSASER